MEQALLTITLLASFLPLSLYLSAANTFTSSCQAVISILLLLLFSIPSFRFISFSSSFLILGTVLLPNPYLRPLRTLGLHNLLLPLAHDARLERRVQHNGRLTVRHRMMHLVAFARRQVGQGGQEIVID